MENTNLFLNIDGIDIEDLEAGDYSAYEQELGVSERMISGRLIEELRATIWVVKVRYGAIDAATMAALNAKFKASRDHALIFLPSTGGTELASGTFHLREPPAPALKSWTDETPMWEDYELTFEEVTGHA